MAYDLYVLNQRLPRFPLREGYADAHAMRAAVDAAFQAWLTEAIIGNLQRRRACSQVHDFAGWMETKLLCLEVVTKVEYARYLEEIGEGALCDFTAFLGFARRRLPDLHWGEIQSQP